MLLFLSCPIMSIYDYHHSEYINEKMSNSQICYILHMCIMSPVFNQTLESAFQRSSPQHNFLCEEGRKCILSEWSDHWRVEQMMVDQG